MADIVITIAIIAVILADIIYLFRSRKKGKCTGCPYADGCAAKKTASCVKEKG
ncbi:MAG: FeoB-associated Cys-rich membrane protein [Lachnospiraceae bacterium]|nr:FeoB-associated Cys-rich membrane protein [Lachnospiraceae bacterium]MBR4574333.1 FeoB-associated Cys-rich membrane protein [Lachnospiraceae bacterium]